MIHNDTIQKGATFYRELSLFSDAAKTVPLDITGKTIRATLMDSQGAHVANFACAVIAASPAMIAWTMPRATTATLTVGKRYTYSLDLDDAADPEDIQTDRAAEGKISVTVGQVAT